MLYLDNILTIHKGATGVFGLSGDADQNGSLNVTEVQDVAMQQYNLNITKADAIQVLGGASSVSTTDSTNFAAVENRMLDLVVQNQRQSAMIDGLLGKLNNILDSVNSEAPPSPEAAFPDDIVLLPEAHADVVVSNNDEL